MSESNLKKQINNLRNTLFDKDKADANDMELNQDNKKVEDKLVPANINSKNLPKSSGIFHDIKSMDGRLERLEDTFYNYAYDSTKVLTSFHKNTKILESLINELAIKNDVSDKSLKKIEKILPHTCPLVPKDGQTVIKRKKEIFKTIIYYLGLLALITIAVFMSNIIYEIIYYKLNSK
jgi:hypothetical protein